MRILQRPKNYSELKYSHEAWSRDRYAVTKITYDQQMPLFHLQGHRAPLRLHEILKATNLNEPPRISVPAAAAVPSRVEKEYRALK